MWLPGQHGSARSRARWRRSRRAAMSPSRSDVPVAQRRRRAPELCRTFCQKSYMSPEPRSACTFCQDVVLTCERCVFTRVLLFCTLHGKEPRTKSSKRDGHRTIKGGGTPCEGFHCSVHGPWRRGQIPFDSEQKNSDSKHETERGHDMGHGDYLSIFFKY